MQLLAGVAALFLILATGGAAPAQPVGNAFTDCAECPEMVVVPAGRFAMGSEDGEPDEQPVRTVTIPQPLAVGRFPVTFAEYDACVDDGFCLHRPYDHGWGRDRRPVVDMPWAAALAYTAWLSQRTGRFYRLLSEAEWEYAARAGTTGPYAFDGTAAALGDHAWFAENAGGMTHPVGLKKPNAFGLYDMYGNVLEWVRDCYRDSYADAPTDGSAVDLLACIRVVRGGSFRDGADALRATAREWIHPGSEYDDLGFRVVSDMPLDRARPGDGRAPHQAALR